MMRGLALALLVLAAGVAHARQPPKPSKAPSRQPAPNAQPAQPARVRYSHAAHQALKVEQGECRRCHDLASNASALPPLTGKDHAPCSDPSCHASEFFAREPVICRVCHDGAEPWKRLPARLAPVERSEFGTDISHAAHAEAVVERGGDANGCRHCHGDPYRGTGPADGHAQCAPCHGTTAEPAMGSCGDCHELGQRAAAEAAASAWSVADQFSHRTHGTTPAGNVAPCGQCHAGVAAATTIAQVEPPTMQSCDPCHDGRIAFKTTGFQCYRCHAEGE